MKKMIFAAAMTAIIMASPLSQAADYVIDTKGAHASINFKINHLGYSWLLGRFNDFEGNFSYDAKAADQSTVAVTIQTASIDSNHTKRDNHLRSADFLDVEKYPTASFKSTSFEPKSDTEAMITGDFTLHGVTQSISFPVTKIGEGEDRWGGYRAGFEGQTTLKLADYGITYNLGPASTSVQIDLFIEGKRQ